MQVYNVFRQRYFLIDSFDANIENVSTISQIYLFLREIALH